jgi:hypothetical protein
VLFHEDLLEITTLCVTHHRRCAQRSARLFRTQKGRSADVFSHSLNQGPARLFGKPKRAARFFIAIQQRATRFLRAIQQRAARFFGQLQQGAPRLLRAIQQRPAGLLGQL